MLNNQDTMLIVANANIKNNIAILVSHIQKDHNIINKFIYHAMNVDSTEAELFTFRCGIDQVTKLHNVLKVVIIINTILAAKKIINTSTYLYQLYSIAISKSLREFFNKNPNNLISF